jgi:hypothetical protein
MTMKALCVLRAIDGARHAMAGLEWLVLQERERWSRKSG